MQKFYAYIRVSTVKQGEGVSLQEQRAAIEGHARRANIEIVQWFEETVTAAKAGRPLFTAMLKGLRARNAEGVIIHKIDRSARNLRDWADLGDLIDAGVAVHFANESLDLLTRGGRLSADLQAVIAADFIRNLREETRKGIRGRLRQGLYPFKAPLGYLDTGKGQVKAVDPIRAPLVRKAFEMYGSGTVGLHSLLRELTRMGFRTRSGKPLVINGLSLMLNSPFYAGIIKLPSSGEVFPGKHQPLISMRLFNIVQDRLRGRTQVRQRHHDHRLRGLFRCAHCARYLTGELQKGRVYYRCQTKRCASKSFREDRLEAALFQAWQIPGRTSDVQDAIAQRLKTILAEEASSDQAAQAAIEGQLAAIATRQNKLTDAYLDAAIDRESFESRKQTLLEERRLLEDRLQTDGSETARIERFLNDVLELAFTAQQSYEIGNDAFKRRLVNMLTSNLSVSGNQAHVEPHFVFQQLRSRCAFQVGCPTQDVTRTFLDGLARELVDWAKRQDASALS